MRAAMANLLLALVWVAVTGNFSLPNLMAGWVLAFGVLAVASNLLGTRSYVRRCWAAAVLTGVFLWELLVANLRIAHDLLTPRLRARPAIVAVDLDATGDWELLLFSTLVTLTPGSVVVHVRQDRRRAYVYGMYAGEPDSFRERIKRVFERRILAVTRSQEENT